MSIKGKRRSKDAKDNVLHKTTVKAQDAILSIAEKIQDIEEPEPTKIDDVISYVLWTLCMLISPIIGFIYGLYMRQKYLKMNENSTKFKILYKISMVLGLTYLVIIFSYALLSSIPNLSITY